MIYFLPQVHFSYNSSFLRLAEKNSVENPFMRGRFLGLRLDCAIIIIEELSRGLHKPWKAPAFARNAVFYTLFIVGIMQSWGGIPKSVNDQINVVYQHAGDLAHVILVVSSVALFALGNYLAAGLTLGFIALTYCIERKMVPMVIVRGIDYSGTVLSLFLGSWFTRLKICYNYVEAEKLKPWRETRQLQNTLIDVTSFQPSDAEFFYHIDLTDAHIHFTISAESQTLCNCVLIKLRQARKDVIDMIVGSSESNSAIQLCLKTILYKLYGVDADYDNLSFPIRALYEMLYGKEFQEAYSRKVRNVEFWEEFYSEAKELVQFDQAKELVQFDQESEKKKLFIFLVQHRILKMPEVEFYF